MTSTESSKLDLTNNLLLGANTSFSPVETARKLVPAGKGKSTPKHLREKGKTNVTEGGTSDTLVAASNCLGESLSLRVIYKAVNVNPRWTTGADEVFINRHNLPMTAGGRNIHISYSSNRKGGMTPIEFKKWVEEDTIPHCPNISPEHQYVFLLDGDDSHAIDFCNME